MDLGLLGKVALVAGASRGLGKAVAMGLAREGVSVAVVARNRARIEAVAREIQNQTSVQTLGIAGDVTSAEDIHRIVNEAIGKFSAIDILVTNAGGPPPGAFVTLTDEQWRDAVNLTLLSAVRLSRAAIPHVQMQKWGRIIHICSYSVKHPIENLMLSNSIRSAVVGLSKTQALELGKDGITVNSVLPGWTATERVEQLMQDRAKRANTTPEEQATAIIREIPLGRMAKPEEFANVVVFLASERASYVNGVALAIDGGATRTAF